MRNKPTGKAALGKTLTIIISATPAVCVGVRETLGGTFYTARYCDNSGNPQEREWASDAFSFPEIENVVELRKAVA